LKILIRSLESGDWEAIKSVYLEGLATGQATFETEAPSPEDWDSGHLPFGRIGAYPDSDGRLVGWAALSSVSKRKAYAGVAEVSVYVAAAARGQGVGRALLQALILESERNGIWTCKRASFPRTRPASNFMKVWAFEQWDTENAFQPLTECGAIQCSWNVAASWLDATK